MAGQSQAANLGGMLSQVAGTLGTGVDAEPYVRGVQNTFRPVADSNNPEDLQGLLQWQQRMGRDNAARTTMGQLGMLDKQRKEAEAKAKEARDLNIKKAAMASKARLADAIAKGDVNAQRRESDILDKMGAQFGLDSAQIKSETEATQLRLKRERAAVESKQTAEQVNAATSAVIDKYGIDSPQFQKLKEAPIMQQNRDLIQTIESRELQLLNSRQKREETALEQTTPPDVSYVTSVISNPKIAESYPELQQQLEVINSRIKGKKAGKWLDAEKRSVLRDIANLERDASRKLGALEAAELADEKAYERERNAAATYRPTDAEVKAYIEQNPKVEGNIWDTDFTYDEAIREIQGSRVNRVDELYGKTGESSAGETTEAARPADVPQEVWDVMTPEERAAFN